MIELENCEINLFFPLNKELNRQNYLSISMKSLKNNKIKNLDKVIKFISDNINVYTPKSEIIIPNILNNVSELKFTDLKKQSTSYKNFLSLLVRYNMIENKDKFEGNSPIKW
jgi:hypothetical protein